MKKLALVLALVLLPAVTFAAPPRINVGVGNNEPLPIAIPDLIGDSSRGQEILSVLTGDLERSGLFHSIDKASFIEKITAQNVSNPSFTEWRQINAQVLLTGSVVSAGGGKIQVDFRLWDTLSGKQIAGKSLATEESNWRRIAHMMADEIYSKLTGETGYFDTRILYVSESGSAKRPVKRLAIMDQDGANHKFLTDGGNLVLTPRFSPNSQKAIYLSYAGNKPRVYLRDIETGSEQVLGDFAGMTFAPRFSPKGNKVALSAAIDGNSEIYVMDLGTRQKLRLTNDNAIDTSPSFSPNEGQLVFNSDRGGSQQLYVMSSNGSGVKRISFGEGRYGSPVWSPRGDLIAFTKMHQGKFYIGVMRPDGSGERLLTESYLDESPTWSPNGRVIIFTRQTPSSGGSRGTSKLYSVDLTGYNMRELVTPTDASDPAWSPLLN